MKIFVLTFGILLILPFTVCQTTDTSSTSIPETYNLINATGNLAKPGCSASCGDLIVPYPFGVGLDTNCSIGKGFDVYCNTSFTPHRAYLRQNGYVWFKKISDSTVRTSNLLARRCYTPNGTIYNELSISYNNSERPYTFSQMNKFTIVGCNDYSWLTSATKSGDRVSTGCMVFCSNVSSETISSDKCPGNGCCRSDIPRDMSSYTTRLRNLSNSVNETSSKERCTFAFVGEEDAFKYNGAANLLDDGFVKRVENDVQVVLDWAIGNRSCDEVKGREGYACQLNSVCVDSVRESGGYRCQCDEGYEGNPYLSPGCQGFSDSAAAPPM